MSVPNPFTDLFEFPVEIGAAGLQPQTPASLLQQLINAVAAVNPGYTVLPAGLIEDITSTQVAGIAMCDQAKVDLVNSLTPYAANIPLLLQLGALYGVPYGLPSNTSVVLVFYGTVGYVIPNGFLVTDGQYVYQVQGGGVIQSSGASAGISAVAVQAGTWSVAVNTVTQLVTSIPSNVVLTVTNPSTGTPGQAAQGYASYRAQVLQAGLASSVGTARYIKTLLNALPGVTPNLVSVQQNGPGGIRVVASGPDVYAVAYAIFQSVADPSELVGSAVSSARNVTVSLYDPPDTYTIVYVETQTENVTVYITWNTTATNFSGGSAFPGLVQGPISAYIESLAPGQVINVFEMDAIFQQAVADVLDPSLLTRLVFSVSINGVVTAPASGTGAISGDPESDFYCPPTAVTVVQG